jgi:hypothetical protein
MHIPLEDTMNKEFVYPLLPIILLLACDIGAPVAAPVSPQQDEPSSSRTSENNNTEQDTNSDFQLTPEERANEGDHDYACIHTIPEQNSTEKEDRARNIIFLKDSLAILNSSSVDKGANNIYVGKSSEGLYTLTMTFCENG